MSVKRSITDLLVKHANPGKLNELNVVADEYMWVVQCYARHIVGVVVHPAGHGQAPLGVFGYTRTLEAVRLDAGLRRG